MYGFHVTKSYTNFSYITAEFLHWCGMVQNWPFHTLFWQLTDTGGLPYLNIGSVKYKAYISVSTNKVRSLSLLCFWCDDNLKNWQKSLFSAKWSHFSVPSHIKRKKSKEIHNALSMTKNDASKLSLKYVILTNHNALKFMVLGYNFFTIAVQWHKTKITLKLQELRFYPEIWK